MLKIVRVEIGGVPVKIRQQRVFQEKESREPDSLSKKCKKNCVGKNLNFKMYNYVCSYCSFFMLSIKPQIRNQTTRILRKCQ